MDRCDTDPYWFLFATDGRPFFAAWSRDQNAVKVLKTERRRAFGCHLEQRSGNYAAATLDQMLSCWPGSPITTDPNGSFVYVSPHDVQENAA